MDKKIEIAKMVITVLTTAATCIVSLKTSRISDSDVERIAKATAKQIKDDQESTSA